MPWMGGEAAGGHAAAAGPTGSRCRRALWLCVFPFGPLPLFLIGWSHRPMKRLPIFCLLAVAIASAAPAIRTGGVVNAATNSPLGTQGSGIAQGSYFAI